MLEYFPGPYPDEVLYSVWARYSDHVQYPGKQDIFQELFGNKNAYPVVDLPCHLKYFVDNLPTGHNYTVDLLINRHTLLPFYGPFLPQERYLRLRQQMMDGNGKSIHRRGGIATASVPRPLWLRYCPRCVQQDKESYGECYWHRLHQVTGVEICPLHKTFLEDSNVRAGSLFTCKEFVSAERAAHSIPPRLATSSPYYKVFMDIATDVSHLLAHTYDPPPAAFFRQQYHTLLAQGGYVTAGQFVRSINLLNAFVEHYPPTLLTLLHCEVSRTCSQNNVWVAKLPENSGPIQPPLHHILAIRFLGSTAETFFQQSITAPTLFGEGPWPCLNPVCEYYRQRHISAYQKSKRAKQGHVVAVFTCDCGFAYTLSGTVSAFNHDFRRESILSYGRIWETKLRELWLDPTLSLGALSRRLGFCKETVKRQATKLYLPVPRPLLSGEAREAKTRKPRVKDASWYREQWTALMNDVPEEGILALANRSRAVYSWLYRNDKDWLETHRPCRKPLRRLQTQMHTAFKALEETSSRKDESIRDAQTAEAVSASAAQLVRVPGPPKRVTVSKISRDVPQLLWLKRQPEKAPLTAQALEKVIETREEFAVRRVKWIVQRYQDEQACPKRGELIRRASLSHLLHMPLVQQAIEEAMVVLT